MSLALLDSARADTSRCQDQASLTKPYLGIFVSTYEPPEEEKNTFL